MFFLFTASLTRNTKVTRTMRHARTGDVRGDDYGRYFTVYGIDFTLQTFRNQRCRYANASSLNVSVFFGQHHPYTRSTRAKFLRLV